MGFARITETDLREYCTLTHRQLRVMLALRLHGSKGYVWPGQARISELTGIDRRHIRRTLAELAELGLIEIASTGKGHRSSRYRILSSAGRGPKQPGAKTAPSEGAKSARREGAKTAPLTDKEQAVPSDEVTALDRPKEGNPGRAPLPPRGGRGAKYEKGEPERSSLRDRLRSRKRSGT